MLTYNTHMMDPGSSYLYSGAGALDTFEDVAAIEYAVVALYT